MNTGSSLDELIRERDRDALSGFFDGRAGYVIAYCSAVCPPDTARDAVLAAFVEFLSRVAATGPDPDLDLLLVKATRGCAAARLDLHSQPAICRATPELLAASANGELIRGDEALAAHLERCTVCEATAKRLLDAESTLKHAPSVDAPADLREQWLRAALGDRAIA
jgi:hypothetical protein